MTQNQHTIYFGYKQYNNKLIYCLYNTILFYLKEVQLFSFIKNKKIANNMIQIIKEYKINIYNIIEKNHIKIHNDLSFNDFYIRRLSKLEKFTKHDIYNESSFNAYNKIHTIIKAHELESKNITINIPKYFIHKKEHYIFLNYLDKLYDFDKNKLKLTISADSLIYLYLDISLRYNKSFLNLYAPENINKRILFDSFNDISKYFLKVINTEINNIEINNILQIICNYDEQRFNLEYIGINTFKKGILKSKNLKKDILDNFNTNKMKYISCLIDIFPKAKEKFEVLLIEAILLEKLVNNIFFSNYNPFDSKLKNLDFILKNDSFYYFTTVRAINYISEIKNEYKNFIIEIEKLKYYKNKIDIDKYLLPKYQM